MQPQDLIDALAALGVTTKAQFSAIVQAAILQLNINTTNLQIAAARAAQVTASNTSNAQIQALQAQITTWQTEAAQLPLITVTPPAS